MIYFIAQNNNTIKIGYSKNIKKRINSLKTASPYPLLLLGYIEGNMDMEKFLHEKFKRFHLEREWFSVSEDSRDSREILDFVNDNTLTNTYCDFDDNGVLRVYKKMKNIMDL